ncbi:MAG: hypothetical protein ABJA67_14990 [Chthonomonadales bacterium]
MYEFPDAPELVARIDAILEKLNSELDPVEIKAGWTPISAQKWSNMLSHLKSIILGRAPMDDFNFADWLLVRFFDMSGINGGNIERDIMKLSDDLSGKTNESDK